MSTNAMAPNRSGRASARDLAALLLASVIAFWAFPGRAPAYRSQELRVLETAREMGERGDLVVPTFCGQERFEKPPLAYWLALGGYLLAGDANESAGRLYSALAGTLTVLIIYALGVRMGGPRLGLWAGLILSTSLLFVRSARHAETDALLTCLTAWAFYAFWRAFEASSGRGASRLWAVQAWVAIALAFLAKGPAGLLFPLVPASIYLLAGRRFRDLWLLAYPPGVLVFLAIASPWFLAVCSQKGESLAVFLRELRTVEEGTDHGKENIIYALTFYLIRIWQDFAPWCPFLVPTLVLACRRARSEIAIGFLLAWAGGILLQLELIGNKQPHYLLPAFPALALLAAWWLERQAAGTGRLAPWWPQRCRLAILLLMLAGTAAWAFLGLDRGSGLRSCREFALAIRPAVDGAPVYLYGSAGADLDFYLRRVIPRLGRDPRAVENLRAGGRPFFLIARDGGNHGAGNQPELQLDEESRFRLVRAAPPQEIPYRLYQAVLPVARQSTGPSSANER